MTTATTTPATTTVTAPAGLLMATDDAARGFAMTLAELADELGAALDRALWTFTLQAELEEALDAALFRATLAATPTLTGTPLATAA